MNYFQKMCHDDAEAQIVSRKGIGRPPSWIFKVNVLTAGTPVK